ncbi:hypothetical protein PybrP1_000018 [[Pythium] brassicae (nom. inval.)]|nr:hypothetical protein PybrP1_000018 [[Pythium] brassicae (nom. inval.)]
MIGDAVRWATSKVDEKVVNPVATRLATSVANPHVLSFLIWERIKKMTPQRARDVTRLLSTAVANALGVLGAEKGKALTGSAKKLQDEFVNAAVSRQGRDVLLNTVATASKVAQALNTPETKVATTQVFEALQSLIDFFASEPGRKVIATAGECMNQLCEVAASPESSIFLAEIATNVCHALDAEAQRRDAALDAAAPSEHQPRESDQDAKHGAFLSPTSSAADTGFETESNASEAFHFTRYHGDSFQSTRASETLPRRQTKTAAETSASRSARIEKDVLLKMGVEPGMIGEIQRILDTIAAEDESALMQREDAARATASDDDNDGAYTDEEDGGDDAAISHAFGLRSPSPLPVETNGNEQKTDSAAESATPNAVLLPDWHRDEVRHALRRRHVQDVAQAAHRNTYDAQAKEIATVLAHRKIQHGDLSPADVVACQAISRMITYCTGLILLMMMYTVYRTLLGG